jgi:hypothetical protein
LQDIHRKIRRYIIYYAIFIPICQEGRKLRRSFIPSSYRKAELFEQRYYYHLLTPREEISANLSGSSYLAQRVSAAEQYDPMIATASGVDTKSYSV